MQKMLDCCPQFRTLTQCCESLTNGLRRRGPSRPCRISNHILKWGGSVYLDDRF